jgi:hypothetical protein
MEARVTKVARVSGRFSKSLARRRLRPNQEKVPSTTQRCGSTTKPFLSSLRLTIAMRRGGAFATAASTCQALLAAISPNQFEPREALTYLWRTSPVTVLDRGGIDNDPHRQPFAVDRGSFSP